MDLRTEMQVDKLLELAFLRIKGFTFLFKESEEYLHGYFQLFHLMMLLRRHLNCQGTS